MVRALRGGLKRNATLVVSGGLVALLGVLGIWAGHAARDQAARVHRADRLTVQRTLAGLTAEYTRVSAAEILDLQRAQDEAGMPPWPATPGSAASVTRLRTTAAGSRALAAGAVLVAPSGVPLAAWTPLGSLPSATDPGWLPLRADVARHSGTLPVSGVLHVGRVPLVAVGVPVRLDGGQTALLIGLAPARTAMLQKYVGKLRTSDGRRGYVVDASGVVIAGPDAAEVGAPLAHPGVVAALRRGDAGMVETSEQGTDFVTSYARAGDTGWTALTIQDRERFDGDLLRAARRAQAALVLLLLIAGTALVLLHRKREVALRTLAVRDELTGLYNRRGWFAVAAHELERAKRCRERRALLFLDVDGLKQVNDLLGHREGDRVITDAAAVVRSACRSSDVIGRLGGDEFVVLLGNDGEPAAVRARVAAAVAAHNAASDAPFELRLSIGAEAWYPEDAWTLDELVRRADESMYVDKSARPARSDGVVREPVPPAAEPAPV